MKNKRMVPYSFIPEAPVASCDEAPYGGYDGAEVVVFAGMIIRDAPSRAGGGKVHAKNVAALQTYFNDMYFLFLYNLTRFAVQATTTDEERQKLKLLFEELLRTRKLLEKDGQ